VDSQKSQIAQMATSAFPHLKDRIAAGETIKTISDPYRQTMSNLLELNPDSVQVDDPMIRQALQVKDPKTGVLSLDTLYDFENKVRSDSRWDKTSNARDAASNTANKILSDFGLLGG
jgi:methionine synthase II (cobalamin-independent)